MQKAITAARTAGTTVVVAAGNDSADAADFTPGNCQGVITVGATGLTGKRSWYSNFGSTVEISAPGGDSEVTSDTYVHGEIISTLNSGTSTPANPIYEWYQGTSMATPHVVGVVALMLSRKPSLTPAEIETAIKSSATQFPADSSANGCLNNGITCGAGILNARAAIDAVVPLSATSATLTGPTSGVVAQASSNFSVAPNSYFTGTISVAVSGGGLNTTITKTFNDSFTPQNFTITPTTGGQVTLTTTSSPALTNPARIIYNSNFAGLTPTFSSPVRTLGGYTVNVTNFNNAFTYSFTTNAGTVTKGTANGSTLPLTVTKLANTASATVTVSTSRSGYMQATDSVTAAALPGAPLNATFSSAVRTADGFTVNVTNYDKNYVFTPSITAGKVTAGKVNGAIIPLTVTGLTPGQGATVTMTTTRDTFSNGVTNIQSAALSTGLKPTLSTPVPTANGFTVNVTNYDPNFVFAPAFDPTGGSAAFAVGAANGATLPLTITGLTPGQARTIVVTATRAGYTTPAGGRATAAALLAALVPTFDTPVKTATGFTVNVTNYANGYTYTVTTSAGTVTKGNASGKNLPLTVSGLTTPSQAAIITVTVTRAGYATGSATVNSSRL
jgi:titin